MSERSSEMASKSVSIGHTNPNYLFTHLAESQKSHYMASLTHCFFF